jgi:anti-sigma B factor antagonist
MVAAMTDKMMMMTTFVEHEPMSLVVHVAGEIDVSNARHIADEVGRAISENGAVPEVVIDLTGVSYIDARGLAALVESKHLAHDSGKRLVLANPSRMVLRLIRITDLAEDFPVIET